MFWILIPYQVYALQVFIPILWAAFLKKYLFLWLRLVSVVARAVFIVSCGIFCCGADSPVVTRGLWSVRAQ